MQEHPGVLGASSLQPGEASRSSRSLRLSVGSPGVIRSFQELPGALRRLGTSRNSQKRPGAGRNSRNSRSVQDFQGIQGIQGIPEASRTFQEFLRGVQEFQVPPGLSSLQESRNSRSPGIPSRRASSSVPVSLQQPPQEVSGAAWSFPELPGASRSLLEVSGACLPVSLQQPPQEVS